MISARDSNGRYIGAGWAAPTPNSLWGVHTVPSAALAAGTGLVLDTSQVALLDRQEAQVLVGFVGNQFTSNAATILAELRAQLAVYDPHAISVLTLPSLP
jgi:HK97 family phage major capsid protein